MSIYVLYLIILIPCLASLILILSDSQWKIRGVATIASAITFILSIILFSGFYTEHSSSVTLASPGFLHIESVNNFLVKLSADRLSALFTLLSSCLFLTGAILARPILEQSRVKEAALLLMQAFVFGIFLSNNLLSYTFFAALFIIPSSLLFDFETAESKLGEVRSHILGGLVSTLLILVVIIGEKYLSDGTTPDGWLQFSFTEEEIKPRSILFFILCFAFLARLPAIPTQLNFKSPNSGKHPEFLLFLGTTFSASSYGFFRFIIGTYKKEVAAFSNGIAILSILSMIGALIWILRNFSSRNRMNCSNIFWSNFIVLSACTISSKAWEAALFGIVAQNFLFLVSTSLITVQENSGLVFSIQDIKKYPIFSSLYIWINAANYFLPVSLAFYCAYLLGVGIIETQKNHLMIVAAIIPVMIYILFKIFVTSEKAEQQKKSHVTKDLDINTLALFLLPIFILLTLGAYPELLSEYLHLIIKDLFSGIGGI